MMLMPKALSSSVLAKVVNYQQIGEIQNKQEVERVRGYVFHKNVTFIDWKIAAE